MQDLTALRQESDAHEEEMILRLRATTIQESVRQWVQLQEAFEPQLQATAHLFAEERRQALADLQAKLYRLVERSTP
jgi:hypothetical protein